MDPKTILETAGQLSGQSDRYLFIATLIAFGCFTFFALRYLISAAERQAQAHSDARGAYELSLRESIAVQSETSKNLAVFIERNTIALADNTLELRRIRGQV